MVVTDFNVVGVSVDKAKTDPPLVVDRNRVLPLAVAPERVKPVARRYFQIVYACRQVDIFQFSGSPRSDVRGVPARLSFPEQLQGESVREGLDHVRQ